MHTQLWIKAVREYQIQAWQGRRKALWYSLYGAAMELEYTAWCEAGLKPSDWSNRYAIPS